MVVGRNNRLARLVLPVVSAIVGGIVIFPLLWMVVSAFKTQAESYLVPPRIFPQNPSFSAFREVLTETTLPNFIANSAIVGISTTLLVACLSVMAVFSLTRVRVPGAELIARSTLIFYTMPPILLVVPVVQLFLDIGLVNTLYALIVAYTGLYLPLGVWIFRGYVNGLDPSLEQAAMLDGLSMFQAFFRIGLREALPGLAVVAFFTFNATWNEFLYASLLIQKEKLMTMPAGLASFIGVFNVYSWPMLMAAGIIAVTPIFIFYLIVEKRAREAL